MIAAFFGMFTLIEWFLLLAFIVPLAMATGYDRNGRESYKWWILFFGFIGYCGYYAATAPPGDWFPPVGTKAFWTSSATWNGIAYYAGAGLVYVLVEMLVRIFEEKQEIKAGWAKKLATDAELVKFVDDGDLTRAYTLKDFCASWNSHYHLIKLKAHELDRVPTPSINAPTLNDNLIPWVTLWPFYLISLLFGRVLDRIAEFLLFIFRAIGNGVLGLLFNNTFKTKP